MLEVRDLLKRFGGLTALDHVSLTVQPKRLLGLIGVNGSGKTTLLNCLSGLVKPNAGQIVFEGSDLAGLEPHQFTRRGVGRTFQVPRLFLRMTLTDNMLVPILAARAMTRAAADRAAELLASVDLYRLRDNYAEELSGGQQKLIELLRLDMFSPKLVLLDEPFAGVHPDICIRFIDRIVAMRDAGAAIILVSHDLNPIYALSNEIAVLNEGKVMARGSAEMIRTNPDVIEAFLGQ